MTRPTILARLWRLATSRGGRLALLLALPLMALQTRGGWQAAVVILSGYAVGTVAFWIRLRRRAAADRDRIEVRGRWRDYVVPRELPASPPFVGRQQELALLRAAASKRSDRAQLIVIQGPAGIGKSALALHFAQTITEQFEDGQLFASMRRYGAGPPADDVAELLTDFIRSIESPSSPPSPGDLASLRARYARLTRPRRLLIVLDDAPSANLVRELLPTGPGSLVIVTTRVPLDRLDPAAVLSLEPLPQEEALRMFQAIVGHSEIDSPEEQSHAQQIVRQSRGYPSALQLVGATVSTRPKWSLAPVARLLDPSDDSTSRELSRDVLDLSYALLTEDERRAVRLLGVLREGEPLAPWMLSAFLPEPAARGMADRLVHAGLVERVDSETAGVTEYRVHDHVHAYARRLAVDDGQLEQLEATLGSVRGDRLDSREFKAVQRRVQELQDKGKLLEAMTVAREAVAWAMDQGMKGVQAAAQATLAELQIELGNLEAAEDLASAAAVAADEVSDPLLRAQASRALGRLLRREGQPEVAVKHHSDALASLMAAHHLGMDDDGRIECIRLLRHRAAAFANSDQPERGLEDLDEADRLERAGAPTTLRAGLTWARGTVVARTDRLEDAAGLLAKAKDEAGALDQPLWQAWIVRDLAQIQIIAGEHETAITNALSALNAFGQMSHRYGKAKCRLVIAQAVLAQGSRDAPASSTDLAKASTELEKALETFRNCGDRWIEAATAVELANVRNAQLRGEESTVLLRTALSGFTAVGDQARASEVRRQLGLGARRRRSKQRSMTSRTAPYRSGSDPG